MFWNNGLCASRSPCARWRIWGVCPSLSRGKLAQHFIRDFEIRVDVLDVVLLIEAGHELYERLGPLFFKRRRHVRPPHDLRGIWFPERLRELRRHIAKRIRRAV